MRWIATVLVHLFEQTPFIWSENNNKFFHSNVPNFGTEKFVFCFKYLYLFCFFCAEFYIITVTWKSLRILLEVYGEYALMISAWKTKHILGVLFKDEELPLLLDADC